MHMHFLPNSLSDPIFETYLRETHRIKDYRDVRDNLLPQLFASFAALSTRLQIRFNCSNRFEGQYPAIRIQCPVGFVPDEIQIEFPHQRQSFVVHHTGQMMTIHGQENLHHHLRVILTIGLAHWFPT